MEPREIHAEIRSGWELVAAHKYRQELPQRLELLRGGGHELFGPELEVLGPLLPECRRVIHLQCSHGLDALGLLNLGVREVVGLDISAQMLEQAREVSQALGARASWIRSDVLDAPASLDGTADLVYTGKGALPWMMDIDAWARVVHRLLRPGGRVYVFEGHPLNAQWELDEPQLRLREGGPGYFQHQPIEAPDFPSTVVEQIDQSASRPRMVERHWRPGQVVGGLIGAGLRIERLDEHPEPYWNQFPQLERQIAGRLPRTYSILASRPSPE